MAQKPKSKNKKSPFADAKKPAPDAVPPTKPAVGPVYDPARQRFLVILFLVIAIGGGMLAMATKSAWMNQATYTYREIDKFPHDKLAFTQGLFFLDSEKLVESTGKYGESTLRLVDLKTGEVEKRMYLGEKNFGEGCVQLGDKIYQLTWKEGICFVYDLELNKIDEINYEGQGWGLTTDGTNLFMTDGTSKMLVVDPKDFSVIEKIYIKHNNKAVARLNELEYVGGKIYANQLDTDLIYEINAKNGKVEAVVDLSGLWPVSERPQGGVLNGIAYDKARVQSIFVTGKYCPHIYEIEFELK